MSRLKEKLSFTKIYQFLLKMYGPQSWWPADTPFEVMIGAILTQNTSWTNVEKAIFNLKQNKCLTAKAINSVSATQLAEWLRPAGYFNVKARRLQNYCQWFLRQGGYKKLARLETMELRKRLLEVSGVGFETADDILLYAFHRPIFVIDAYTRRLLVRLKLSKGHESYEELREQFERNVASDAAVFNEYHALIVIHAKMRCRKNKPVCENCQLRKYCHYGVG